MAGETFINNAQGLRQKAIAMNWTSETCDLLVLAHSRWDLDHHRGHNIFSRYAQKRRVFYFEEPSFGQTEIPRLHIRDTFENVMVVTPHLPNPIKSNQIDSILRELIDELIFEEEIINFTLWLQTPRAFRYARDIDATTIIYECMEDYDNINNFSENLFQVEKELMENSDIIFVVSEALYQKKKFQHHNIHVFPNSADYFHFIQSRDFILDPYDQIHIPHPRIGFYGIIDQSIDLKLIDEIAQIREDLNFVFIGPLKDTKFSQLPTRKNIYYLEQKDYNLIPLYVAEWDCGLLPFCINEVTQYSSPHQTAELLMAGKPIVATHIPDISIRFGKKSLAKMASNAEDFSEKIDKAILESKEQKWKELIDNELKNETWDQVFKKMCDIEFASGNLFSSQ